MSAETLARLESHIPTNILKQPTRKIKPEDALLSSGLINSFSLVDLALFVEDIFGVRIEDSELNPQTFDTLEQLAGLIEKRQAR